MLVTKSRFGGQRGAENLNYSLVIKHHLFTAGILPLMYFGLLSIIKNEARKPTVLNFELH